MIMSKIYKTSSTDINLKLNTTKTKKGLVHLLYYTLLILNILSDLLIPKEVTNKIRQF